MATRPEATGRKVVPGDDADAYSIAEFCRRHGISVPLFYKLPAQGKAPATFLAGVRRLVTKEAAAAWRHEREQEQASKEEATA